MKATDIPRLLGQNIKYYRNRSGWSQPDLAEKINISVPFLSNIEQGKTWVSPATLLKFSSAFSLDIYELFKPAERLPRDYAKVLNGYTRDIHNLLDKLQLKYQGDLSAKPLSISR